MKAIQMSETGGSEVLRLVELPTPQPQPGQVLIRVTAAGVNFGETQMRAGAYPFPSPLPTIPGSEVVGEVIAVGTGVDSPSTGARIAAMLPGAGGYAEYAVAEAATVIPLPENVSDGAALGILSQGLTAYYLLRHAAPIPAEGSVLVQAAAGGVGSLLVQLARQEGAGLIIGTAGTAKKRALALELGVDMAVDYSAPDWADQIRSATSSRGVNVIFESVGGKAAADCFGLLAPFGRFVTYGASSGQPTQFTPEQVMQLIFSNQSVAGFAMPNLLTAQPGLASAGLTDLIGRLADGKMRVVAGDSFPLPAAAAAHAALEGRRTSGKVFLRV